MSDPETLTAFISAIGTLLTVIGGLQFTRDTRVRKERDQLRVELDETSDLLSSALRVIRRWRLLFAGNNLPAPALPPDLEELIPGDAPPDRAPAAAAQRRPRRRSTARHEAGRARA